VSRWLRRERRCYRRARHFGVDGPEPEPPPAGAGAGDELDEPLTLFAGAAGALEPEPELPELLDESDLPSFFGEDE
jgi:hypothetical protein